MYIPMHIYIYLYKCSLPMQAVPAPKYAPQQHGLMGQQQPAYGAPPGAPMMDDMPYTCIHVCVHIYMYIYIFVFQIFVHSAGPMQISDLHCRSAV